MDIERETQIRRIMRDPSLSAEQKNVLINRLRSASSTIAGSSSAPPSQAELVPDAPTAVSNMSLSCEHYEHKKCSRLFFECCQVYDPCHWCHYSRGCRLRPAQVQSIACNLCNTRQPVSDRCVACNVVFGRIHCGVCSLWTEVDVFHCDGCGMCRVGLRDDTYHCPQCDCCWSNEHRDDHDCVGRSWKELSCPFCLESMHYSRVAGRVLPCKHVVHLACADHALRSQAFRCPLCRKAMCDMRRYYMSIRHSILAQPMTPEAMPPIRVGETVETADGVDFVVTDISPDGVLARGHYALPRPATEADAADTTARAADNAQPIMSLLLSALRKKMTVRVICHECEQQSLAPYHFLGLECQLCRGYNTSRV